MRAFFLAVAFGGCWLMSVGCAPESVRVQDNEAQAAMNDFQDDARCRGQGLQEGSSAYGACREALDGEHQSSWIFAGP